MKSADIKTKSQRDRLPVAHIPYWHELAKGQHLGYRKGQRTSRWIARLHTNGIGYRFSTLGAADDSVEANGTHVFDFKNAVKAAEKWFNEVSEADNAGVVVGPYKVESAARDWLKNWRGSEASKANSQSNVVHHILPTLGQLEASKLQSWQINNWLQELATKPPLKFLQREQRQKKLSPSRQSKVQYDPNDSETKRKRKDTANRVFNDLKALLTYAYKQKRVASKAAWETVPRFENVDIAKNEYLTLEEARQVIAACPEDFRNLVRAALITGCRYGELCSLKADAYDASLHSIYVKQAKTGKPKHIFLTPDEAAFIERLANGKRGDEHLLLREDGKPWAKSHQQPRMKQVLKAAGLSRNVRFHDLRHTFATLLTMNGTSLQLVANQLGHTGTRIAEKHYAHFSPSFVAATVRANKPSFSLQQD